LGAVVSLSPPVLDHIPLHGLVYGGVELEGLVTCCLSLAAFSLSLSLSLSQTMGGGGNRDLSRASFLGGKKRGKGERAPRVGISSTVFGVRATSRARAFWVSRRAGGGRGGLVFEAHRLLYHSA